MFSESVIDPATIDAYRQTHYRVQDAPPFVLRVDEFSSELLALHRRCGVDSSVFITAFNPHSQALADAENAARHLQLHEDVVRRSLPFIEGVGQHPSNGWPGEKSLLVMGISLEAAKALGRKWAQNAIVWAGEDATPRLVLLC